MLGLFDRISRIAEMVGAPKQSGARRRCLARAVIGIAVKPRISRFVNHGDDAFALHRFEIDSHAIVMRQIHYAVAGHGGQGRCEKQQKRNRNEREFHRADDSFRRHGDKGRQWPAFVPQARDYGVAGEWRMRDEQR